MDLISYFFNYFLCIRILGSLFSVSLVPESNISLIFNDFFKNLQTNKNLIENTIFRNFGGAGGPYPGAKKTSHFCIMSDLQKPNTAKAKSLLGTNCRIFFVGLFETNKFESISKLQQSH